MKRFMAVVLAALASTGYAAEKRSDEALNSLKLPDVKFTSITHVEGDTSHYDVDGIIGGTIYFEVLLPDDWNERFAMGGGGGFVGSVQNSSRKSVERGYATAGTDTGHQVPDGSFAYNDEVARANFGELAIHRTAEVAKALIRAHYGKDAEYSYFLGCSRGGGQAMMEAQRYPEDFDGIVSGAPAFDWGGFAATGLNIVQAFYPDPKKLDSTVLSRSEIDKLHQDLLTKYDEKDGIKDNILSDPASIDLDLKSISWMTDEQRTAVSAIYDGARNQDGQIYPGFPVGSEIEWFNWLVGPIPNQPAPSLGYFFSLGLFRNFVFNDPEWDYSNYDFSTWATDWQLATSTLSAVDTDLDAFKARDGKLILWHGWSDAALPATRTAQYFDTLLERDPNAHDYARLYLIPGCGHCGGGPGVSSVDWLTVISDWVEKDVAPQDLVATRGREDASNYMERPLASYPKKTVYKGSGDPNDADSFSTIAP